MVGRVLRGIFPGFGQLCSGSREWVAVSPVVLAPKGSSLEWDGQGKV